MFCPKCGSHVQDNVAFCANCGSPMGRSTPSYNPQPGYAPGNGAPSYGQQAYAAPSKRHNPIAGALGNNGPFAIMKLVGIVLIAICLFMPWFRINIDPLIDAANGQLVQAGQSYQLPKLGDLGMSVLYLGDTLNQTGQTYEWLNQIAILTGTGSSMSQFASLQAAGPASWGYRLFGLAWIASIILLAAGAAMSLFAKKGDQLLRIAVIVCVVTSVAGIIIAIIANGQISTAMASMMRSSGIAGFSELIGGGSAATLLNNMFGFTFAPIVTIVASILTFVGSMLDKDATRIG